MGPCLSCFKGREHRSRSTFRNDSGNESDFGGSEHSRGTTSRKKRISIHKKGKHSASSTDDNDYSHETQSLLGKTESNDSSDGGLVNSRRGRSIRSSSSNSQNGSYQQQVQQIDMYIDVNELNLT